MAKEDYIKVEGTVIDVYPNSVFQVKLDNNHQVTCSISGRLRINNIRILTGDRVDVEISPYDLNRGRIVWRHK